MFDALVYVQRKTPVDQAGPLSPSEVLVELSSQRWRSVSAFTWPVGWVIGASPAALEWLQRFGQAALRELLTRSEGERDEYKKRFLRLRVTATPSDRRQAPLPNELVDAEK